jgi:hypothetical protein
MVPSYTETPMRQFRGSPVPSPHSNVPSTMTIGTNRITSRSPSPSISTISPSTPTSAGSVPRTYQQNTMLSITSQQSPSHKTQPSLQYVKRQPSPIPESPRTPRTPRNTVSVIGNNSPGSGSMHPPLVSPRARSNSGGATIKPVPTHEEESVPPLVPRPRRRRTVLIKNYRKGDLIGQGANGRVYLSYNMDYGSLFVIKEITFANVPPSVLEERLVALQREINVMKSLEHENIVQYYGAEKVGTTLNIFLEYVAGGSVASLVKRYGHLSEEVIRQYTKQILIGLQYLHLNMIVHRDIKGAVC